MDIGPSFCCGTERRAKLQIRLSCRAYWSKDEVVVGEIEEEKALPASAAAVNDPSRLPKVGAPILGTSIPIVKTFFWGRIG
jgi:hypothetical protein